MRVSSTDFRRDRSTRPRSVVHLLVDMRENFKNGFFNYLTASTCKIERCILRIHCQVTVPIYTIRCSLRNVINDLNCSRRFHVEFLCNDIDSCKFLETLTRSTANRKIQKNGNFVASINDPIFEYFNIPRNMMHLSPVFSCGHSGNTYWANRSYRSQRILVLGDLVLSKIMTSDMLR